jgi:hypothetical protein
LAELEQQRYIRIAIAGDRQVDVDAVGIVPWRIAMYAATGDVKSILVILKQFVDWKWTQLEFAGRTPPQMLLTYASRSCVEEKDSMEGWKMKPMGSPALHAFDAAPVRGRKHLLIHVEEGDDDNTYDVLFTGYTWPFRVEFESASVQGGYIEIDGKQEYCRMLKGISGDEAGKQRLREIMEQCLKNYAVFMQDNTDAENDDMITFLRGLDSAHYR